MNKPALTLSIVHSRKELTEITKELRRGTEGLALHNNVTQAVHQFRQTVQLLEGIALATEARDHALKRTERLRTASQDENDPLVVEIEGAPQQFALARHLAFQGYVACTWATYDMLWEASNALLWANWKNTRSNALVHANWAKQAGKTFPGSFSLLGLYGWPIAWSYAVRNHFVHDPYSLSATTLFNGLDPESGYGASALISKCAEDAKRKGISKNMSWRGLDWPWSDDLLILLQTCHSDADHFFSTLIASGVDAAHRMSEHLLAATKAPHPRSTQ